MPNADPLTREDEARVRRNVADMLAADWGDELDDAYHPESMCQSDRDLIRLLATLDAERAESRESNPLEPFSTQEDLDHAYDHGRSYEGY